MISSKKTLLLSTESKITKFYAQLNPKQQKLFAVARFSRHLNIVLAGKNGSQTLTKKGVVISKENFHTSHLARFLREINTDAVKPQALYPSAQSASFRS